MSSFSQSNSPPTAMLFPALHLYPLNDTWTPKHIALTTPGLHTKIGRQTNLKTVPGEKNGFFDSKVLSRQHAEVWEEGGKIYIKDVKSSNGTFINGERLSGEGVESEPFELKSDDIVEFGIDIVGEDNKTIIHHKVAARVLCVFTDQDAQVAARAEQHQYQQQQQQRQFMQQQHQQQHQRQMQMQQQGQHNGQGQQHPAGVGANGVINGLNGGGGGGGDMNGAQQNFPFAQRRPQSQTQLPQGLGGMGGMRPPGSKTGLSFDVILSRLQGEVQKSRETGAELGLVMGKMSEVWDVFGGDVPANLPPFPAHLPPVRAPADVASAPPAATTSGSPTVPILVPTSITQPDASTSSSASSTSPPSSNSTSAEASASSAPTSTAPVPSADQPTGTATATSAISAVPASIVVDLQTQLNDTKSSLASHLDKIRELEGVVREQEAMRREMGVLRTLMERMAGGTGSDVGGREGRQFEREGHGEGEDRGEREEEAEEEEDDDDDDDARSVSTVMSHELESVEEEDEEELAAEEEERRNTDAEREVFGVDGLGAKAALEASAENRAEAETEVEEVTSHATDVEEEARKRKEDLEVGRPQTPEPGLLGMDRDRARRTSVSSPLAHLVRSSEEGVDGESDFEHEAKHADAEEDQEHEQKQDVHELVSELTKQVSSVVALTAAMEARHEQAQSTISGLERKVEVLEGLLRDAASAPTTTSTPATTSPDSPSVPSAVAIDKDPDPSTDKSTEEEENALAQTLAEKMQLWKKAVEGQWSAVREEWRDERVRLDKAREEWEARARLVDFGLEKMAAAAAAAAVSGGEGEEGRKEGVKHRGGLVTPPSPSSQSSDSGRGRRRRRRTAGAMKSSESGSASEGEGHDAAEDSGEEKEKGVVEAAAAAAAGFASHTLDAARSLATPESLVYKLSDSVSSVSGESGSGSPFASLKTHTHPLSADTSTLDPNDEDSLTGSLADEHPGDDGRALSAHAKDSTNKNAPNINVQTAFGVVILSVAAAAVFWKIKPE